MIKAPDFSNEQLNFFEVQMRLKKAAALGEAEEIRLKIARTLFGSDHHYAASANAIRLSKLVAELAAKCAELENISLY